MADRANDLLLEIHKGESQFCYFQLGITASAIAFAVHETKDVVLSQAPWPLGIAVALWALSFAIGCSGIDAKHIGLHSNALFLQVFGEHAHTHHAPTPAAIVNEAMETVKAELKKSNTRFRLQKWTLFMGALFYIAGHMMHMAELRKVPPNVVAERVRT